MDNIQENNPPTVIISNPNNDDTVFGTITITVDASDTEDGTLIPDIYIDGTYVATGSSYDWDTTAYDDGPHTISAEAIDSGGLSDSDEISVTVDNGGTGSYMYVSDISWSSAGPHLKSKVTIMADSGNVVSGAIVYYKLTNQDTGDEQSLTGTTDSNGQIEFMWKRAPSGYYEVIVTNVGPNSYTYVSTSDMDNPDYYTH